MLSTSFLTFAEAKKILRAFSNENVKSKEDYLFFLEADRVALRIDRKQPRFFGDEIWKFQRLLRKVEFLANCGYNFFNQPSYLFARYRLEKLSISLGFTIPCNVFGPGLSIAHRGTIVIHHGVKVGENCRIHQGVTIGSDLTNRTVPTLGDNIVIGPGAVIVVLLKLLME
jgi:serine O-acetyltransferase